MAGAERILGVDTNPKKFELARAFGATETLDPAEVEDVAEAIVERFDGGVDYAFECIGNVEVMGQALASCHKGWGQCIVIGVAGAGEEIHARPFLLVTGRSWRGTAFGGTRGRTQLPGHGLTGAQVARQHGPDADRALDAATCRAASASTR